jgi:hypothetical protein
MRALDLILFWANLLLVPKQIKCTFFFLPRSSTYIWLLWWSDLLFRFTWLDTHLWTWRLWWGWLWTWEVALSLASEVDVVVSEVGEYRRKWETWGRQEEEEEEALCLTDVLRQGQGVGARRVVGFSPEFCLFFPISLLWTIQILTKHTLFDS